jgi:hypothetical protein
MNKEADKFDAVIRRLLSVSREEIQRRDKEWRQCAGPPLWNLDFPCTITKPADSIRRFLGREVWLSAPH